MMLETQLRYSLNRSGQQKKVLLITVNYRSADTTLLLLDSLFELKRFAELQVVIVDNGSEDGSVARILHKIRQHENVSVLRSPINRGYFGGAKWALDTYSAERGGFPDWVIVSNNDILIDDSEFLERLFSRDPAAVGVIAPQIRSLQSQRDQNPFMEKRLGRWRLLAIRFWGSTYYVAWLHDLIYGLLNLLRARVAGLRRTTVGAGARIAGRRIYAPHGAFMIFSRKYFESGGYIDDGFFLYGEEITVAEICRRLGERRRWMGGAF
jgi:GT2 family glycosyltransferase